MKLVNKLMLGIFLSLLIMTSLSPNTTYETLAADGSNGVVQLGFSEYIPGNSYVIVLKDLDVSSDYSLAFTTGVATEYNFTTGANEEELSYRVTLAAPTTGTVAQITLEAQSTGTAIDTVRLQATEVSDIINQDEIIDNLMLVLVILVVIGLVMSIYRKMV